MVFLWSLSESKTPQVSRRLLSILAVLNSAVVWIVSTCPPTSKSSRPFGDCTKSTNLDWYNCHFHLPSFASTFLFFSPQVILLFLHALPFHFSSDVFQRLSFILSFSSVFVGFLSGFPVEFFILILIFSSWFLRGSQFFSQTNFAPV